MVYVYRREPSAGARELAEAIEGTRYRGSRIPMEQKARSGDVIVCWGESLRPINGVNILNGTPIQNKYQDAVRLRERGIPTVEVSRTRPTTQMQPVNDPAAEVFRQARELAGEFYDTNFARTTVFNQGVDQLYSQLQALRQRLQTPAPAPQQVSNGQWVGRLNNHVGGNDLLNPPLTPDFFVKREQFRDEIRIHSFMGKSIRAGRKVPRTASDATPFNGRPNEWIRSFDGGWKISYDGFKSKEPQRELAHCAVEALGLQFGAVDIGIKADGTLIVLEVNRAPGLSDGTIESYAKAIEAWLESI